MKKAGAPKGSHNSPKTEFKKGMTPWNKGLTYADDNRMPRPWLGKKLPEYMLKKLSKARTGQRKGPLNNKWKGGITTQDKMDRAKFRATIQKEVLERDDYTCQMCGVRGSYLHVDHIQSWKDYVELRFSMDNCRTLCIQCHYKITFGRRMPKEVNKWGQNFKQAERKVH